MPFVDIANAYAAHNAGYPAQILVGLSRETIANGLSDPTNAVTQAIIGDANYLTAAICLVTFLRRFPPAFGPGEAPSLFFRGSPPPC
jgi:hypothetical protein